jgi:hypothetical protein
MNEENTPKRKIDRVELLPESIAKLDTWQKQIDDSCPEVMMSRKSLANWILGQHREVLNDAEINNIKESFFDSVQYLKNLLKKAEKAKSEGQRMELADLSAPINKPKRTRIRKEKLVDPPVNAQDVSLSEEILES